MKGILEGVRVLGIEQQVAAPYCTMMLSDQGAEVIKVERPGSGDSAREGAPYLTNEEGEKASGYFLRFNRNKKSVTVNTKSSEGVALLKDLIKKSDIIVENFKPGMMDEMGITYEVIKELNPKAVYVAISGFGRLKKYEGPFHDRLAYDIVAQAMGGLMHLAGQKDGPPTWLGVAVGDVVTGIYAAYSALLGYIKALKTGEGEYIDVSMYDCMAALGERAHHIYTFTGNVVSRGPDKNMAPWGPFKAKDGYVALIVPTEKMWARLCKAIGREDFMENENFNSGPKRAEHRDEWEPALIEWMADKTKAEVCEILMGQGMPCGPVQDSEDVFNCPHLAKRELFVKIPDKVMHELTVIGSPIKMENSEPIYGESPMLGEHTDEVLKGLLGYDDEKIKKLQENKII